ncbi:hypothetical protein E2C01_015314 [Portunus trituberculatus]|uniref:Uncharacterized protein n=1 Tax=Portunus trituberculatus TaxID=210409 RepID=A0A5B7DMN1_PORTR|nr:hypothetical protein [Portunus trituberculatus]
MKIRWPPWYSGTMRALGSEGSPSARVRMLSTSVARAWGGIGGLERAFGLNPLTVTGHDSPRAYLKGRRLSKQVCTAFEVCLSTKGRCSEISICGRLPWNYISAEFAF